MKEVRLGIIGIGGMGSAHAESIDKGMVPQMRLTAVADIRPERLRWAEENLTAGIKTYNDGRELIDSGECDAVLIATPHYFHPQFSISIPNVLANKLRSTITAYIGKACFVATGQHILKIFRPNIKFIQHIFGISVTNCRS